MVICGKFGFVTSHTYESSDMDSGICWNCSTQYETARRLPSVGNHEMWEAVRLCSVGSLVKRVRPLSVKPRLHRHETALRARALSLSLTHRNTVSVLALGGSLLRSE